MIMPLQEFGDGISTAVGSAVSAADELSIKFAKTVGLENGGLIHDKITSTA